VKYEIWRNYLTELNKRAIPTYLISAVFRPEQKFFAKGFGWYAAWLRLYKHIYVQDKRSLELLASIGMDRVTVAGDTRFDRVTDIRANNKAIPELERFTGKSLDRHDTNMDRLTIMVGSSWPADEDVYTEWVNRNPGVKVVIAPHEFDDARVDALCSRFKNGAVRFTELRENPAAADKAQVLIMNCFGLLSSAYAYCDIAYVGGGFGAGLHNINEAAVYGVPVIYGPNNHKFIEASEMATLGGGLPINGREGFEMWADKLTHDAEELRRRGNWAGEYIAEKIGATDIIYSSLFQPNSRK
jgi:3-deoxy-D-manno-octulosonic-acid transferase